MKHPIVIIGIGELGGVFARGFLKCGYPVFPVTRETDITLMAGEIPEPQLVLIAVAEKDMHQVLDAVPAPWKNRLALLQNELLPHDWQGRKISEPTVISVWFEKKRHIETTVLIPSPVYGPHSGLIVQALEPFDIPCRLLGNSNELALALATKNIFVAMINIAGLAVGGTTGSLWKHHREFAIQIAMEIQQIQEKLIGHALDSRMVLDTIEQAIQSVPEHTCTGRSAPARLTRALKLAQELSCYTPVMDKIASRQPIQ